MPAMATHARLCLRVGGHAVSRVGGHAGRTPSSFTLLIHPPLLPTLLLAGDDLNGEFSRLAVERITACVSGRHQGLSSVDVTFVCPPRYISAIPGIWRAMQPDSSGKLSGTNFSGAQIY